ncbi:hypothetical protein [Streptomyces sp. NPDC088847]|uniref:hypothetical protein n=1 Tax=Streptomyces sp. NPDC088847 TaxID=3365909 RepID=UPI0037F31C38
MTAHLLVVLILVLGMGALFSCFAGLIGFGIARLVGAPVAQAISWGGIAAFSVMTLFIALLAIVMPLLN